MARKRKPRKPPPTLAESLSELKAERDRLTLRLQNERTMEKTWPTDLWEFRQTPIRIGHTRSMERFRDSITDLVKAWERLLKRAAARDPGPYYYSDTELAELSHAYRQWTETLKAFAETKRNLSKELRELERQSARAEKQRAKEKRRETKRQRLIDRERRKLRAFYENSLEHMDLEQESIRELRDKRTQLLKVLRASLRRLAGFDKNQKMRWALCTECGHSFKIAPSKYAGYGKTVCDKCGKPARIRSSPYDGNPDSTGL